MISLIIVLLMTALPVQAHPLDTAFFDFEQTASGTVLTVAMQPPEAFEVVRGPEDKEWNLEGFRKRGEMLAAFVGARTRLARGGLECEWNPAIGPVADTAFDALADGITVAGRITCPVETGPFTLASDLFTDRFPGQQNLIRLAQGGDFRELLSLTSSTGSATIDVDALTTGGPDVPKDATPAAPKKSSGVTPLLITLGLVVLFGLTQIRHVRFGRGSTDA